MKAALLVLLLAAPLCAQVKLREELLSRQKEGGYTLAEFTRGSIYVADFSRQQGWQEQGVSSSLSKIDDGLLSPDGSLLALWLNRQGGHGDGPYFLNIVQRDGSGMRDYPQFSIPLCWSPDGRRLLATRQANPGVAILNVQSGAVEEVDVPSRAEFTSQCWSSDGQSLIYHVMEHEPWPWVSKEHNKKEPPNWGNIFVYDMATKQTHPAGRGQYVTWSPDGRRIAYWDNDGYYVRGLADTKAKRLRKYKFIEYPVLWSPDSRLVLYYDCCTLWGSLQCMCDVGRWFVYRLSDHAKVQVSETSPLSRHHVWIQSRTRPMKN